MKGAWDWLGERKWFLLFIFVMYLTFAVVWWALWGDTEQIAGIEIPLDQVWEAAVVVYTCVSLKRVRFGTHAAKTFFDAPICNVRAGLSFVPFGICGLVRFSTNIFTLTIGSPREQPIERDGEGRLIKFKLDEKKDTNREFYDQSPYRTVSSTRSAAGIWDFRGEKDKDPFPPEDPLTHRVTADPQLSIVFRITDPSSFLTRVGEQARDIVPALSKTVRIAFQSHVGNRVLSSIIRDLDNTEGGNAILRAIVEKLVGDEEAKKRILKADPPGDVSTWPLSWGVDIITVGVEDHGLPLRVNQALADARSAGPQKDATKIKADGERYKLEHEGAGRAKATQALLEARAEGLKHLVEAMGTPEGKLAARLEVVKEALSGGGNKVNLIGGKFDDVIESLASIAADVLTKKS